MIGLTPVRGDRWLLLAVLALLALGLLMVVSTSAAAGEGPTLRSGPGLRQLMLVAVGLAALLGAARTDYHLLRRLSLAGYALAILLLLAVLAGAGEQYGARRWLTAGDFSVQPSEFRQAPRVAVALAAWLAGRNGTARPVLVSLALLAGVLTLVVTEPDTGTALVMAGAWFAVVIAWGAPWRLLGTLLAVALAVVPLLLALALPTYQRERLAVFFDPGRDPLGSGFNLRQAELALGSGGLTGHGLFGSADSALTHVATRSSDFMLAGVGEQLGLLGALTLLGLLGVVVWRGLEAARVAPDVFGRLLAVGLTATILHAGVCPRRGELAAVPRHRPAAPVRLHRRVVAAGHVHRGRPAAQHRRPPSRDGAGAVDGRALAVNSRT